MRPVVRIHDPVAIADGIAERNVLPMTVDHSPEAIAEAIHQACGGQEPRLDLGQLILEYKRLKEGIEALAGDLSTSDDMDELHLLLATVQEFRYGLIHAPSQAELRLQRLENDKRYNSLSWAATS